MKVSPRAINIETGDEPCSFTISNSSNEEKLLLFKVRRSDPKVVSFEPHNGIVKRGCSRSVAVWLTETRVKTAHVLVKFVALRKKRATNNFEADWKEGSRKGVVKKVIKIRNLSGDVMGCSDHEDLDESGPANECDEDDNSNISLAQTSFMSIGSHVSSQMSIGSCYYKINRDIPAASVGNAAAYNANDVQNSAASVRSCDSSHISCSSSQAISSCDGLDNTKDQFSKIVINSFHDNEYDQDSFFSSSTQRENEEAQEKTFVEEGFDYVVENSLSQEKEHYHYTSRVFTDHHSVRKTLDDQFDSDRVMNKFGDGSNRIDRRYHSESSHRVETMESQSEVHVQQQVESLAKLAGEVVEGEISDICQEENDIIDLHSEKDANILSQDDASRGFGGLPQNKLDERRNGRDDDTSIISDISQAEGDFSNPRRYSIDSQSSCFREPQDEDKPSDIGGESIHFADSPDSSRSTSTSHLPDCRVSKVDLEAGAHPTGGDNTASSPQPGLHSEGGSLSSKESIERSSEASSGASESHAQQNDSNSVSNHPLQSVHPLDHQERGPTKARHMAVEINTAIDMNMDGDLEIDALCRECSAVDVVSLPPLSAASRHPGSGAREKAHCISVFGPSVDDEVLRRALALHACALLCAGRPVHCLSISDCVLSSLHSVVSGVCPVAFGESKPSSDIEENTNRVIKEKFSVMLRKLVSGSDESLGSWGWSVSSLYQTYFFEKIRHISIRMTTLTLLDGPLGANSFEFLESLDVSNNQIEKIDKGIDLPHLKYLNISGNALKSLDHLQSLLALVTLDASHNRLSSMHASLHMLVPISGNLSALNLSGNEICNNVRYAEEVALLFPNLQSVDNVDLQDFHAYSSKFHSREGDVKPNDSDTTNVMEHKADHLHPFSPLPELRRRQSSSPTLPTADRGDGNDELSTARLMNAFERVRKHRPAGSDALKSPVERVAGRKSLPTLPYEVGFESSKQMTDSVKSAMRLEEMEGGHRDYKTIHEVASGRDSQRGRKGGKRYMQPTVTATNRVTLPSKEQTFKHRSLSQQYQSAKLRRSFERQNKERITQKRGALNYYDLSRSCDEVQTLHDPPSAPQLSRSTGDEFKQPDGTQQFEKAATSAPLPSSTLRVSPSAGWSLTFTDDDHFLSQIKAQISNSIESSVSSLLREDQSSRPSRDLNGGEELSSLHGEAARRPLTEWQRSAVSFNSLERHVDSPKAQKERLTLSFDGSSLVLSKCEEEAIEEGTEDRLMGDKRALAAKLSVMEDAVGELCQGRFVDTTNLLSRSSMDTTVVHEAPVVIEEKHLIDNEDDTSARAMHLKYVHEEEKAANSAEYYDGHVTQQEDVFRHMDLPAFLQLKQYSKDSSARLSTPESQACKVIDILDQEIQAESATQSQFQSPVAPFSDDLLMGTIENCSSMHQLLDVLNDQESRSTPNARSTVPSKIPRITARSAKTPAGRREPGEPDARAIAQAVTFFDSPKPRKPFTVGILRSATPSRIPHRVLPEKTRSTRKRARQPRSASHPPLPARRSEQEHERGQSSLEEEFYSVHAAGGAAKTAPEREAWRPGEDFHDILLPSNLSADEEQVLGSIIKEISTGDSHNRDSRGTERVPGRGSMSHYSSESSQESSVDILKSDDKIFSKIRDNETSCIKLDENIRDDPHAERESFKQDLKLESSEGNDTETEELDNYMSWLSSHSKDMALNHSEDVNATSSTRNVETNDIFECNLSAWRQSNISKDDDDTADDVNRRSDSVTDSRLPAQEDDHDRDETAHKQLPSTSLPTSTSRDEEAAYSDDFDAEWDNESGPEKLVEHPADIPFSSHQTSSKVPSGDSLSKNQDEHSATPSLKPPAEASVPADYDENQEGAPNDAPSNNNHSSSGSSSHKPKVSDADAGPTRQELSPPSLASVRHPRHAALTPSQDDSDDASPPYLFSARRRVHPIPATGGSFKGNKTSAGQHAHALSKSSIPKS